MIICNIHNGKKLNTKYQYHMMNLVIYYSYNIILLKKHMKC